MKTLKTAIKSIANRWIKPSIVFESKPAFSDNTKAVYDELVSQGYNKKYMLAWWNEVDQAATIKSSGKVVYWNPFERKTLLEKIRNYSYFSKRKANIICNVFIPKVSGEPTFYLKHGSPLKSVGGYYSIPNDVDYIISQAKAFEEISARTNNVDPAKMISLGFPRNDAFSKDPKPLEPLFHKRFQKVIVWYPTYRQHKGGLKTASKITIPIIHDEIAAQKLNKWAKENQVLIVIKPHFSQDLSYINAQELDNIVFINDGFFSKHKITSYELLNSCDALITDYSSVYYDYTLADKPIGVVWEDIEDYREYPGFAVDLDFWMKGAEKLYSLDDLCHFIENVAEGKDLLKSERREIRDCANFSSDGQNAKRVADFIIEKAGL